MKRAILLLPLLLGILQLSAQNSFQQNTAYLEILGNGGLLSINYERQLNKQPGFGVHAGIGLGGNKPVIPLGITYLLKTRKSKSFIETGLGLTLGEKYFWISKLFNGAGANPYLAAFVPSVGYRHYTKYGLMWKLIYSPFFSPDRTELAFGGVAIGWRF